MVTMPGKFEGEPSYAESYWGHALDGCADEDTGDLFVFRVRPEDIEHNPELAGVAVLVLWEDSQGFVWTHAFFTEAGYAAWRAADDEEREEESDD